MKYGTLIIEKREFKILRNLMSMAHYYKDATYKASLEKFNEELAKAKVLSDKDMPEDVIRLYSTVTIQSAFKVKKSYQLVTPEKSDLRQNKISVLAPMGLALFGYAKGDEFLWHFPAGESEISIIDVEQLELVK